MNIDERQIQAIVQQVLVELGGQSENQKSRSGSGGQYGLFTRIDDAIQAAEHAFVQLQDIS